MPHIENRARVFISCGQRKNSQEETIAREIEKGIESLGYIPYVAINEQTTRGLKENIFQRLFQSEYFLFIDFKRENVSKGLFSKKKYRGSLFSNQELAVAAYLDMPIVAFQEEMIKEHEGILYTIQANPIRFSSREGLSRLVLSKIEELKERSIWHPSSRNELLINRQHDNIADGNFGPNPNNPARYFHVRVTNMHRTKVAWKCVSYIEKILNSRTNEEVKLSMLVENKWRGIISADTQIPAGGVREFDAFHLLKKEYRAVHLGFNRSLIDTTEFDSIYRLPVPGTYEITYVVISESFPPARATFKLSLSNDYDSISFT